MSQGVGAKSEPTNAVLVKFTFITVIIRPCEIPKRQTFPVKLLKIFEESPLSKLTDFLYLFDRFLLTEQRCYQ